jgi:hypothetical protein
MPVQRGIDFNDTRRLFRRNDPASSREAAAQIAPRVGGQLARILELIRRHPDCTAGELAAMPDADADLTQVTICKRVSVLNDRRLIEIDAAGRACRVLGNLARTYRAKASGGAE